MSLQRWVALSSVVGVMAWAEPGALPACPVPEGTCFGEVKFSTGDRYLGEMVKFKMEGTGAMFAADGTLKQAGTWAEAKLVTSGYVDFAAYAAAYPRYKAQATEAGRALDAWRDQQLVITYLAKEPKSLLWSDRVANAVAKAVKDWLDGPVPPPAEVTPPVAGEPPKVTRESWETNKEFDARVARAKGEFQKETARAEAEYKAHVKEREAWLKAAAAQRALRAKKLSQVTREFALHALASVDLTLSQQSARVDPNGGTLSVEVSIDGDRPDRYEFRTAPVELRKSALRSATAVTYKPEFQVGDKGQVSVKAMKAEAGGFSAVGVPVKH